jgi:signal transduction histidine kinase
MFGPGAREKPMAARYPTGAYSRCPGIHVTNIALDNEVRRTPARAEDWLIGGGEMGQLVRRMDWSSSALGPIEGWPQSLREAVSLCLASSFPISIAWGPRHVQIYNDGYWSICGGKHPDSMGQDFSDCWASAWPVIGEAFERALTGETSYFENERMFLDRNGYLEESFFTFSFSPIRDECGGVGGVFHPVTETTGRMLAERRTRALRDLAVSCGRARSSGEALRLAAQTLQDFELDLPFVALYELDELRRNAQLVACTGSLSGTSASPTRVDLRALAARTAWPLAEVARDNRPQFVAELEACLGSLRCGPYRESPPAAWALPITLPGAQQPMAVLLAGVSSRLPMDDAYRAFYESLAAGISAALANVRAHEEDLRRAQAEFERANRELEAFSYSVSHDLRAPLRAIDGFSKALLSTHAAQLDEQGKNYLDRVRAATRRMGGLIDALLNLSRISCAPLRREQVDITRLGSGIAEQLRRQFPAQVVSIEIEPGLAAAADPRLVGVTLENLLANAWKFTSKTSAPQITLGKQRHAAQSVFYVRDNGAGFDMAYSENLFRPFQRLHSQAEFEGTGIGLATVQRVINRHGGRVWAEGAVGAGATFYFTLESA